MRNIIFGFLSIISVFGANIASANDNIAIDLRVSGEIAPGVYGHVNIGNEHPAVINQQAIIVKKSKNKSKPIYLVVPPGHAKHWDKHCAEYNACDRQVYFINSEKYNEDYRHKEHDNHGHDKDEHHDHDEGGHGEGHGHEKD